MTKESDHSIKKTAVSSFKTRDFSKNSLFFLKRRTQISHSVPLACVPYIFGKSIFTGFTEQITRWDTKKRTQRMAIMNDDRRVRIIDSDSHKSHNPTTRNSDGETGARVYETATSHLLTSAMFNYYSLSLTDRPLDSPRVLTLDITAATFVVINTCPVTIGVNHPAIVREIPQIW